MRWALIAIVVIGPPAYIAWRLLAACMECESAAIADIAPSTCPQCLDLLEFDDEGSNLCLSCGSTWWTR